MGFGVWQGVDHLMGHETRTKSMLVNSGCCSIVVAMHGNQMGQSPKYPQS